MKKLVLTIFVAIITMAVYGQDPPVPEPPQTGDVNGCLKVVKNGFVDCWNCWGEVACSEQLSRSSGCFGDCEKDCGVCVGFTLENQVSIL